MDERIDESRRAWDRAIFGADASGLDGAERGLDALQADLDLARGRLLHARFLAERREPSGALGLFESAADGYRRVGDRRGEAEALFMVGIWHQVVRQEDEAAIPCFERARELAAGVGDGMTVAYALRHLSYVALSHGRVDDARRLMRESTDLRRELGFVPGVAMNLLAMAEIEAAAGDRDAALGFVAEAERLAAGGVADAVIGLAGQVRATL